MKKIIFHLLLIFFANVSSSQTFTEDFNAVISGGLPVNWVQFNVDNLSPASNLFTFGFGSNAWVVADLGDQHPAHKKVICSTSWYNPAGQADDWLMTPSFSVTTGMYLSWEAMSLDAINKDGYQVLISTASGVPTTATFTNALFSTSAETGAWTVHNFDLSSYAGQTIRIAFRNNSNDQYVLCLDNVRLYTPLALDGGISSIDSHHRFFYCAYSQFFQPISGKIKNYGSTPISSAKIQFWLDQDTLVSQTFTFNPPIAMNQEGLYSLSYFPSTFSELKVNHLKVWTKEVNNVPEINKSNDTTELEVRLPPYSAQSYERKNLVEVFNSANCQPCKSVIESFDSLQQARWYKYGNDFSFCNYQISTIGPSDDPGANAYSESAKNKYHIGVLPAAIVNGIAPLRDFTDDGLSLYKGNCSFVFLQFVWLVYQNGVINCGLRIVNHYKFSVNSPVKLYVGLAQHYYEYQDAFSQQKKFHHVFRDYFPGMNGVHYTGGIGSNYTYTLSYNVNQSNNMQSGNTNFWHSSNEAVNLIAYLRDTVTNEIIQSTIFDVPDPYLAVPELPNHVQSWQAYPNPAQNYLNIQLATPEKKICGYEIRNTLGQLAQAGSLEDTQQHLDISMLPPGMYFISIRFRETCESSKFLISR